MKFRKPNSRKKGIKFLVYGESGVGKTMFALSFPKSVVIDSEDGYSFYEGTEAGNNLLGILDSQSFYDVEDAIEEVIKHSEDYETFVIDSETKIYENLQETLLTIDEKRARQKGQDELDANISMRSWGKIRQIARKLQNAKIRLATKGINVVSVAQSKEVMEDIGGGKRIKTGDKPSMQRDPEYDYDVVLQLFTQDGKYYGRVLKDRTGTLKTQTEVENPTFDLWKEAVNKEGEILEKDFVADSNKSMDGYEKDLDLEELETLSLDEQVRKLIMQLDSEVKKEVSQKFKDDLGITVLSKASDSQLKEAVELIKSHLK